MKKLIFAALLALNTGAIFATDIVDAPVAEPTEAPRKEVPRDIDAPANDVTEAPAADVAAE